LIPRKQSDQLSLKIRQLSNAKSDSREECVTELVETAVDFATPIFEELDKEGGGDDEEELHVCLLRIDHMNKPSGSVQARAKRARKRGLASAKKNQRQRRAGRPPSFVRAAWAGVAGKRANDLLFLCERRGRE
jgi:hypothetical protein